MALTRHSLAEHARMLAAYLPNGGTFGGKNILGSNVNQLIRGIAGEIRSAEGYLVTLEEEYFPDETTLFLEEWERAVGIPDDCFPVGVTAEERRANIVIKLVSLGVQTAQDFVDLALLFGKTVDVFSLAEEDSSPEAKFTIVVAGVNLVSNVPPYDIPLDLVSSESLMECVFKKLKPENCDLIFRNTT